MRVLLTPEIAPKSGVVLFRPGRELISVFHQGRVLIETVPESMTKLPSGRVQDAYQPLAEDNSMLSVFESEAVIYKAGGLAGLDRWLERSDGCQYPYSSWHAKDFTLMRHEPGAIRLCFACDNMVRDHFTAQLAGIARKNLVSWLISVISGQLGFGNEHVLTIPELCWWLVSNNLSDVIPYGLAQKALRLPEEKHQSVMKESEIVPSLSAKKVLEEKVDKILALKVDPETPESYMKRPKRRRWENEKYTRWVKTQPCACCNKHADDPHHLIGHGQGGMGTKAHDLFVLPLCRTHHRELHEDTVAFEAKYGDQLTLIFRFLDRALAIGVLA